MSYYLVRAKYDGWNDQTSDFIKDSYWENGYNNGKFASVVNGIKPDDILLLADGGHITHVAKCIKNIGDGKEVRVDEWIKLKELIYFPPTGHYIQTITKIDCVALLTNIFGLK